MKWAFSQQPPIKFGVRVPFAALPKFAAHEKELFAGEKPLVAQQGAQIGELLPIVARHAAQERAFAVDNLVVRKRQDEVLVMVIEHGEGEVVLVIFPINGVATEIAQG